MANGNYNTRYEALENTINPMVYDKPTKQEEEDVAYLWYSFPAK